MFWIKSKICFKNAQAVKLHDRASMYGCPRTSCTGSAWPCIQLCISTGVEFVYNTVMPWCMTNCAFFQAIYLYFPSFPTLRQTFIVPYNSFPKPSFISKPANFSSSWKKRRKNKKYLFLSIIWTERDKFNPCSSRYNMKTIGERDTQGLKWAQIQVYYL